jgi:hypothetical protein
MSGDHRFPDLDDLDDDGREDVRHVQPYEAVKAYRCPGCDHEIRSGEGHEVVVPRASPQDRRHWHSGCWRGEVRRRNGRRRSR